LEKFTHALTEIAKVFEPTGLLGNSVALAKCCGLEMVSRQYGGMISL
jgi:hypothetical protein